MKFIVKPNYGDNLDLWALKPFYVFASLYDKAFCDAVTMEHFYSYKGFG
jgi:hypothetical protein